MHCADCGVEVSEHQKFCSECGGAIIREPHDDAGPVPTETIPTFDAPTERIESTPMLPSPDLGDAPTERIDTTASDPASDPSDAPTERIESTPILPAPDLSNSPTERIEITTDRDQAEAEAATTSHPAAPVIPPPGSSWMDDVPLADDSEEWFDIAPTEPIDHAADVSPALGGATVTAQMPALFDGHGDLAEYAAPRQPFRIRLILIIAFFGLAALSMSFLANVIDIRTTRPAPGIVTGARTLEQLGSNLGLAGLAGGAVMVLGGLLASFGLRWGAGLAGGAGLALVGWSALTIGLAEFPIAVAQSITRTSSESFTLRVTRDLGWWLIIAVGVIGLIVFIASLRSIGTGGRAALNPLIAAITAVAMVVLAFGPLVPVNGASIADNFGSSDPSRDLPTAFFAGRLTQVALIAFVGVIGMLIVRSWGLGLAAGGVSVPLWLWISSLAGIGVRPVGIADRNPGAEDTVPHAVTTVGMVAALALLLIAAVVATYRLNRRRPGITSGV